MNTAWSDILWYIALGAFFLMMMRKGGCCAGHHHKKQNQRHNDNINVEHNKLS